MKRNNEWKNRLLSSSDEKMVEVQRLIDSLDIDASLAKSPTSSLLNHFLSSQCNSLNVFAVSITAKSGNSVAKAFLERVNNDGEASAVQWLVSQANDGDAQSQYVLSVLLSEEDEPSSQAWAMKAARQGHFGALNHIAYDLMKPVVDAGFTGDCSQAEAIYRILSDAGVESATRHLIMIAEHKQRDDEALALLEDLVKQHSDDPGPLKKLLWFYFERFRYTDFMATLRRLANDHRDSYSMVCLGQAFLDGIVVERDPEMARHWFEKAVQSDCPTDGRIALAKMYIDADGVEKNVEKGIDILIDGIEEGHYELIRLIARHQKENLLNDRQKKLFEEKYTAFFLKHRQDTVEMSHMSEASYLKFMKSMNGFS